MTITTDVKAALTNLEALSTTKGYVSREKIWDRTCEECTDIVDITVTKAASAVATSAENHGLINGDQITFRGMVEMTELNGTTATVAVTGAKTFTFGVNSSAYGAAETTGGDAFLTGRRNIVVSAITKANPGVATCATAHGLATGNKVRFYSLDEMTELNNSTLYAVTVINTTTFSIIDTSDFTAETTGGLIEFLYSPRVQMATITSATPGVVTCDREHNGSTGDTVYFDSIQSGYVVITGITNQGGVCRCAYTASDQFLPVTGETVTISGSDISGYNLLHTIGAVNLGVTFDTDIVYSADGAACTGESAETTMEALNNLSATMTKVNNTSFSIGDQSAKMKGAFGFCYLYPKHRRDVRERVDEILEGLSDIGTRYARSGLDSMGRLGYKTI